VIKVIREKTKRPGNDRGAEVSIDCVAYAPHRQIDVQKWDADYVFFSYYKVRPTRIHCRYILTYRIVGLWSPFGSSIYSRRFAQATSLSSALFLTNR
jgi:hypothetical protein